MSVVVAGWRLRGQGDLSSPFPAGISPYTDRSNTTLIKGVSGAVPAAVGAADGLSGGYDWRLTMTDIKENMVAPSPRYRWHLGCILLKMQR